MPVKRSRNNSLYGFPNPTANQFPDPIVTNRAPGTDDQGEPGQMWIDQVGQTAYIFIEYSAGSAIWGTAPSGGTSATSFTVNPGNLTVTAGNIIVSAGDVTASSGTGTFGTLAAGDTTITGTLDVSGASTFTDATFTGDVMITGDFDLTDTGSISLTSTNNAAGAITLLANGGTSETILIQSAQGTGDLSINLNSAAGGITLDAGTSVDIIAASAGISIGTTGTGDIVIAAADEISMSSVGATLIATGAGALNLGTDTNAHTVTIGNSTGATSVVINAGTGALNVGTNAIAHVVTIGNVTGATAVNINTGTAGSTYTTTNGTLGFVTGTGAINIGADAAAKTITVGNVTGATAVNVNTGTGGSAITTTNGVIGLISGTGAINIGADAAAKAITVGNATGNTAVTVNVGTGALNLGTTATAHATNVGSTTAASTLTLNTPTGSYVGAANGVSISTAGRGVSLPGSVLVISGAGSPNTVVTAAAGSLFLRTDPAGATSRAYINTDGATAWTNLTAAA